MCKRENGESGKFNENEVIKFVTMSGKFYGTLLIVMLIAFGAFGVLAMCSRCPNLEKLSSPKLQTLFDILTGLFGGCFSAILLTILIENNNNKISNRKKTAILNDAIQHIVFRINMAYNNFYHEIHLNHIPEEEIKIYKSIDELKEAFSNYLKKDDIRYFFVYYEVVLHMEKCFEFIVNQQHRIIDTIGMDIEKFKEIKELVEVKFDFSTKDLTKCVDNGNTKTDKKLDNIINVLNTVFPNCAIFNNDEKLTQQKIVEMQSLINCGFSDLSNITNMLSNLGYSTTTEIDGKADVLQKNAGAMSSK